jgi:CheY-like chemotaxis protein/predicted Zn-dependent protease
MRQIDFVKLYRQMHCLVVDDMPDIRVSLTRMLRTLGAEHIDFVATGDQAIEACASRPYQLVLCDYNLGDGRDGQQVLEELRFRNQLNNTSIFVMVTAESSREMVLGALEYQPDDYITKPITLPFLRQRLDRVLMRHRELYSIKQALDEKDYATAEQECSQRLTDNTKYRHTCLQIQAEMNLRLLNFNKAENIYTGVLEERPLLWAKLGLGKTQLAKKELALAEQSLKEVIAMDKRVVEAQDLLADTYLAGGDKLSAQEAMQTAAETSPKSVLRQRRLAALAKINQDTETCLQASRKALRIARNSCHEHTDDYLNLARELTDLEAESEAGTEQYAKETFEVLQRLEKRPYFDANADIQTNSLKARSLLNRNKGDEASNFLSKAKDLFDEHQDQLSADVGLDFAQTLIASGDRSGADKVLRDLVKKFPEQQQLLAKVDSLSSTPTSPEGLKKVADMTKAGIAHYDAKRYPAAIKVFKDAIAIFPGHIGLNLNLIQVMLAEAVSHGDKMGFEKLCKSSLKRIDSIAPDDPQYARFVHLRQQVEEFF